MSASWNLKANADPKRGFVSNPIVVDGFNKHTQVDLIDMQSKSYNGYKFILNYVDLHTKFVQLRPLKGKKSTTVTKELLQIFFIFGPPEKLQSDNGKEFKNALLNQICQFSPSTTRSHGKPRKSQSQGCVERANQDVENIMKTWLKDNPNCGWPLALGFVQLAKNSSYSHAIKMAPYKATLGVELVDYLSSSEIPSPIVDVLSEAANNAEVNIKHYYRIYIYFEQLFLLDLDSPIEEEEPEIEEIDPDSDEEATCSKNINVDEDGASFNEFVSNLRK